jgi:pilus assembly protein CpaB
MRLRDIIGLILALLLAIGVVFLTRIFLTKEEKPGKTHVRQQEATRIIIANKTLSPGDTIKQGDLIWQEWPKSAITPTDLTEENTKLESFTGSIVRFPIHKGNPLVKEELVKREDKGLLAAVVTPGKRAVSIDVTASASDSGLIFPGDYVDVILSTTVSANGQQVGKSKTILKNIKVLAFDTTLSSQGENPKTPPHVATLEMTPQEAEILMAGTKEGVITLSLHSLEKGSPEPSVSPEPTEAHGPAKESQKSKKITLMRGKDKSEVEFQEK